MPRISLASKRSRSSPVRVPPGRVKLAEALKLLLERKEFNAITTAQISRTSGVNEALIYKYFGDKRGLLHHVLGEFLDIHFEQLKADLKGIKGALNKLTTLIRAHIHLYETNRIVAKILLLEVRNYPGYFESESYKQVRRYSRTLVKIIEEGRSRGEIRTDIPVGTIRQAILGGIEHVCLPGIIYNRPFSTDELSADLCAVLFDGIKAGESGARGRSAARRKMSR
ncbi:MAG TPA: TetR/AcrR family transcriptional regulator [Syntrophales bacterium]|nr:TetR/AcrR family transcriptional regulator [Syntrophales bacterium]